VLAAFRWSFQFQIEADWVISESRGIHSP